GTTGQRWRCVGVGPDDRGEEMTERLSVLLSFEVQLDDQILPVADRSADPVSLDAGPLSRVGETIERRFPGGEISDRVLDAQSKHEGLRNARSANNDAGKARPVGHAGGLRWWVETPSATTVEQG